jgi:hypothetical protein
MRKLHGRDEYQDLLLAHYKVSVFPDCLPGRCIYQSDLASPKMGRNASHTALPFSDRVSP